MSPPTVDIAMEDPSPAPLFEEAIETIQSTLSEEERRVFSHYADTASMLEDMRSLCSSQKEHQRLLNCSRKIGLFSHVFAAFFDTISIYAQPRPDWLCWFWGSIGLVFKLGSNYVLFLEKIADMFESIAHALPQYQQFHDSCRRQFQEVRHDQMITLMSYVYADIIQFCLELYHMFSRGSQGAQSRHRAEFLTTVLWRPLDARFAQLQLRLAKHKQWFETEMGMYENIELLAQHRKELLDVQHLLKTHSEANGEVEAGRMLRRSKRVDRVRTWLWSNEYRDVYEQSVRQRDPNSCSWFLSTPEYCKWKNAPFDERVGNDLDALRASWPDRVLFIQAQPGFGKTVLSGQIVDDLSTEAEDLNISDEPPSTVFFHFNSIRPNCTSFHDAFRALADQLVQTHRHNRPTLDALALLMRSASGQQKASTDDVVAVLALLLRQHPTFLVIDGVDECCDTEMFLTLIQEICRISDCRVLLLSRPNITIPLEYQRWASGAPHVVLINESHNAADIDTYVNTNLNQMADQGFFGIGLDRTLITQIGRRSKGMFLWANLLIKYLQSPGLSPNERRTTLEEVSLLEGLEPLYRGILRVLGQRYGKEKAISVDIFRWLSLSIKPLNTATLHTALAITPGQPTTEDQYLLHFTQSVSRLTCGLVEVADGSVSFIHRSVKEYLQSPECQELGFSLYDESAVHAHLAARCISYLANDVPKRPLQRLEPYTPSASIAISSGISFCTSRTSRSADSGYKSMPTSDTEGLVEMDRASQTTTTFDFNLPFLRYAALCWPVHLYRALVNRVPRCTSPTLSSTDPFSNTPWLPALSHFLTERAAVTTWVEASWRYSLPPNLSRLVPLLINIKSEIPPATIEGRELRWVVHGLRQLSDALNELRGDYGFTLRDNPSLVWQWNIQAATEGGFWPVWDERKGCVHGLET
ncbi:uncharacterized protein BDR25DRAFT_267857 [Lindgomyces ingoldianus]|uniref:Uncharacterized protein n=1 Tax=Lindgomyces ingoldianus TaxID=673940 RepID=A0ACB6QKE5_9PLEO|nr:uncharacterized protein BDR25DRAFT_267857 [Lindgomyces ingoldianus]KAF2467048.1 hypothetical protein BDR25DRAFT_267857 [Lindgomyces ingoldianus]